MNMVLPNEGKLLWLQYAISVVTDEDFSVDLFSSNTTVGDASTAADFTIATFTGYAAVSVARSSFSAPTIVSNVANMNRSTAPAFTCTGGSSQTCYGWIMRGVTSGKIYCGQNFDVARVMSTGVTETLSPFTLKLQTLH